MCIATFVACYHYIGLYGSGSISSTGKQGFLRSWMQIFSIIQAHGCTTCLEEKKSTGKFLANQGCDLHCNFIYDRNSLPILAKGIARLDKMCFQTFRVTHGCNYRGFNLVPSLYYLF
ncbi:hypothetical protein ACH5RR_039472 [Cinchona calisaya]|uniref:Uncharacterized protein n=1 Tax=Cinchona calisaya TaxID=153742 RepID=A0ABD2Y1U3_9GENT